MLVGKEDISVKYLPTEDRTRIFSRRLLEETVLRNTAILFQGYNDFPTTLLFVLVVVPVFRLVS